MRKGWVFVHAEDLVLAWVEATSEHTNAGRQLSRLLCQHFAMYFKCSLAVLRLLLHQRHIIIRAPNEIVLFHRGLRRLSFRDLRLDLALKAGLLLIALTRTAARVLAVGVVHSILQPLIRLLDAGAHGLVYQHFNRRL